MVFKRRDRPPFLERARAFFYPRRGWGRALEYLSHRVRRIPDTPHRIAFGFACGVFASFSPLFGLHLVYAAFLAWLLRGNIVASLIGTLVGNPLTFPIIASLSMTLGRRILGYGGSGRDVGRISVAFKEAGEGLWEGLMSLFGRGTPEWHKLDAIFTDVLLPYQVGGLLPGLVLAAASYYLTRPLIAAYQKARSARLAERISARATAREAEANDRG